MTLKSTLVFAIGFILTAGWYLVRNFRLYGNLLETDAAIKHFGQSSNAIGNVRANKLLTWFCPNKFQDFFSGYGMLTVNLPDKIIYLLTLAAIIGVWGSMFSKKENPIRGLLKGSSLIIY